jgi:hypothetical protein
MGKKKDSVDLDDPIFRKFEGLLPLFFYPNSVIHRIDAEGKSHLLWFNFNRKQLFRLFYYEYSTGEEVPCDQIHDTVIPDLDAMRIEELGGFGDLPEAFHRAVREVRVSFHKPLDLERRKLLESKLSFTKKEVAYICCEDESGISKKMKKDECPLKESPQGRITQASIKLYLGIED